MKKNILFTRVGYHYVPTTNLSQSIDWYINHLGLKLISRFEDRGSDIAVMHYPHKNAIALLLVETNDYKPLSLSRNGLAYPILAMNCPDIEYTYEFMKEKGVKVDKLQTLGAGEAKYFYFEDNQGNLLEAAWSKWDPTDEMKEDF